MSPSSTAWSGATRWPSGPRWRPLAASNSRVGGYRPLPPYSYAVSEPLCAHAGLGRENSKYGMDEFLETKYICMGLGYKNRNQ